MQVGVMLPQTEIGQDPAVIRDYAQAAEELGYSHILTYEHVLGAHPDRPGGWDKPFDYTAPFHEPLMLFSYLAGVTRTIGFTTGILILPQRQTALVAKQAAALDILSGGRLRLGVGIGWNPVEYESLNETFTNRGRRVVEQIEVLRALWSQEIVDFEGRWHRIDRAGIRPLPVQQPLPLWMGGMSDIALRRSARVADGWIASGGTPDQLAEMARRVHGYATEAGRPEGSFGVELRLAYGDADPMRWKANLESFRAAGAAYVHMDPGRAGFEARGHIEALRRFKEATG